MEVTALKAQIRTKSFDHFYIFTGPEWKIMKIYIEKMSEVSGLQIKKLDSIPELAKRLNTQNLLVNAQICILYDFKDIITTETLQNKIDTIQSKTKDIFIFVFNDIDKRTKFYKKYQDKIIVFNPMDTDQLIKYVQKEIPLSVSNAKTLIEICENDYGRTLLEVDKIRRHALAMNEEDVNKTFKMLLDLDIIYAPPKDKVFAFVDAVLKNQRKAAYRLLEETYEYGEATLVIISNLYNSAKQLLQVQSYTGHNLADAGGLTPFQIKLAKERIGYYTNADLVDLVKLARDAEVNLKSGLVEEEWAVLNILAQFWG